VSLVNYTSDLFHVEVSHFFDPVTLEFTLIPHNLLVSNYNLLELSEFLLLPIHFNFTATPPSHQMSAKKTSSLVGTQNSFKLPPAQIFTHASTSETPSFAREGKL
jgi:hypothetical protein